MVILLDHPGYGKPVALAHLASQSPMHDPEIGDLAEYFPILIHAAELNLTGFGFKDINEIITTSIS
jgi:hypothetical protein